MIIRRISTALAVAGALVLGGASAALATGTYEDEQPLCLIAGDIYNITVGDSLIVNCEGEVEDGFTFVLTHDQELHSITDVTVAGIVSLWLPGSSVSGQLTFGAPGVHQFDVVSSMQRTFSTEFNVLPASENGGGGDNQGGGDNTGGGTVVDATSGELANTATGAGAARLTITGGSMLLFGLGAALATTGGVSLTKAIKARKLADV